MLTEEEKDRIVENGVETNFHKCFAYTSGIDVVEMRKEAAKKRFEGWRKLLLLKKEHREMKKTVEGYQDVLLNLGYMNGQIIDAFSGFQNGMDDYDNTAQSKSIAGVIGRRMKSQNTVIKTLVSK